MNDLIERAQALPDTVEDLSKFILIGREKAVAMSAEIRAIQKAGLAREVYDQKIEEQRVLAGLILDAEKKVGEFTRAMPKSSGGRPAKTSDIAVGSSENRPKSQVIKDLGFSAKQVERFEKLADNPDLVERVKAEAREAGGIPTRARVIDLAQARDRALKKDLAQIDHNYANLETFRKATQFPDLYLITDAVIESVAAEHPALPEVIASLGQTIQMLAIIKSKLIAKGGK